MRHYFSDDTAGDLDRLADLVDTFRPARLFLGHGGPVAPDATTLLRTARSREAR